MKNITKPQNDLLILLKNGNTLFAYQDFKRFVMSPNSRNAKVISPMVVNALLDLEVFDTLKVKHGYELRIKEKVKTRTKKDNKGVIVGLLEKLEVNRLSVHSVAQAAVDGFTSNSKTNPYKVVGGIKWTAWQVGQGQKMYNKRFENK